MLYVLIAIFFIIVIKISLFEMQERTLLYINDGKVCYDFTSHNNFRKLVGDPATKVHKEIPFTSITAVSVVCYVVSSRTKNIAYTSLFVYDVTGRIGVAYEIENYQKLFDIFKTIYSYVAGNLKKRLINFIINADAAQKHAVKFPLAIRDGGIMVQYARNPYDATSKFHNVFYPWQDLRAELQANNMACLLTSKRDKSFEYEFNLLGTLGVPNAFDYYVLYELIQDVHTQNVSKLSELSY